MAGRFAARQGGGSAMAKVCAVTGKRPMSGNKRSHANNKSRRRWEPNLQWKKVWVPSKGCFVRMRISMSALRTIGKIGYEEAIVKAGKQRGA
jgi:large subunit ribosomal protein L28